MRMAIRWLPARSAGMVYVAVMVPPAPVSVVPTAVPPIPNPPYGPIVTTKLWFGGKLYPVMVTVLLATTEFMKKYGYPVYPEGGGDAGTGVDPVAGVDSGTGAEEVPMLVNQL